MIQAIPADQRHFADHGWLRTYWLFSFAEYHDPDNLNWGNLRVFNDDVVAARSGFPMHFHREMEIVTIVHSGVLTHTDSLGNRGQIKAGEVQAMSAGRGIEHSEMNEGDEAVELFQLWLLPRQKRLAPAYSQRDFSTSLEPNRFVALASGEGRDGALPINSNATIYRLRLEGGHSVELTVSPARHIFVYARAGEWSVNGAPHGARDQLRIHNETALGFFSKQGADLIMVDSIAQEQGNEISE